MMFPGSIVVDFVEADVTGQATAQIFYKATRSNPPQTQTHANDSNNLSTQLQASQQQSSSRETQSEIGDLLSSASDC